MGELSFGKPSFKNIARIAKLPKLGKESLYFRWRGVIKYQLQNVVEIRTYMIGYHNH